MAQSIDLRRNDVARGAVLRHADGLFRKDRIDFESDLPARLSDIVLGEIQEPVTHGAVDARVDGIELFARRDGKLVFSLAGLRPGLIAVPVGNRYAPHSIQGGLHDPVSGKPNGEVTGGTKLANLACGNIAGFVNHLWPPDRPLTTIRVLGTIVNAAGRPVSLRDFVPAPPAGNGSAANGILVGGAAMERGKTTFCCALVRALRGLGADVHYLKATGTSCFLSDPLRVQAGDPAIPGEWGCEFAIDADELRVGDFVDACGVPSDLSTDPATFSDGLCRYLDGLAAEVQVAELADSLHHRTNAALLRSTRFRSRFGSLVYVVDPSLDAAANFVHYVRDILEWDDVRLAFAGALATDPQHAALRNEVRERLGVICLDPANEDAVRTWVAESR